MSYLLLGLAERSAENLMRRLTFSSWSWSSGSKHQRAWPSENGLEDMCSCWTACLLHILVSVELCKVAPVNFIQSGDIPGLHRNLLCSHIHVPLQLVQHTKPKTLNGSNHEHSWPAHSTPASLKMGPGLDVQYYNTSIKNAPNRLHL